MTKKGKCLLPVLALGMAQELILILNELKKEDETMKDIPIYYAGSLAQKSLSVFRTYRNMVGNDVKKELDKGNDPFQFKTMDEF